MKILLKTACGCYKLEEVSGLGRYHIIAIALPPAPVSLRPMEFDAVFQSSYRQRRFEFRGHVHNYQGELVHEYQEVVE